MFSCPQVFTVQTSAVPIQESGPFGWCLTWDQLVFFFFFLGCGVGGVPLLYCDLFKINFTYQMGQNASSLLKWGDSAESPLLFALAQNHMIKRVRSQVREFSHLNSNNPFSTDQKLTLLFRRHKMSVSEKKISQYWQLSGSLENSNPINKG